MFVVQLKENGNVVIDPIASVPAGECSIKRKWKLLMQLLYRLSQDGVVQLKENGNPYFSFRNFLNRLAVQLKENGNNTPRSLILFSSAASSIKRKWKLAPSSAFLTSFILVQLKENGNTTLSSLYSLSSLSLFN